MNGTFKLTSDNLKAAVWQSNFGLAPWLPAIFPFRKYQHTFSNFTIFFNIKNP
ncbi:hypothetical protein Hanom_Chr12g01072011 [Helianthus anomalus]